MICLREKQHAGMIKNAYPRSRKAVTPMGHGGIMLNMERLTIQQACESQKITTVDGESDATRACLAKDWPTERAPDGKRHFTSNAKSAKSKKTPES